MTNIKKIYIQDRGNKKFIIVDKIELSINYKIYNTNQHDYKLITENDLWCFKKERVGYGAYLKIETGNYRVVVYPKKGYIQFCFFWHLNGNRILRQCFFKKIVPNYLSTDGNDNYISVEEAELLEKKCELTRYRFTTKILPGIVMNEFHRGFREVMYHFINPLAVKLPHASAPKSYDKNTFSITNLEMANDIPIPKYFSYSDNNSVEVKEFDPTIDPNVLANISMATITYNSFDYIESTMEPKSGTQSKRIPVTASWLTYSKGTRQNRFELPDGACGDMYLKDTNGKEMDIARVETKYSKYDEKGKKKDTLYKIAGRKAVTNETDIRLIFKKTADHNHNIAAQFLDVKYPKLTAHEKRERMLKILRQCGFNEKEISTIMDKITISVKFYIKTLQLAKTRNKIRTLIKEGKVFKRVSGKKSGLCVFKMELLGS